MKKIDKSFILFYVTFYTIYIILPGEKYRMNMDIWQVYFPIKLMPLFLAFLWGRIYVDIKELYFFRSRDIIKFEYLRKKFVYKNTIIFIIGTVAFLFIFPSLLIFIRNEWGINLSFLITN